MAVKKDEVAGKRESNTAKVCKQVLHWQGLKNIPTKGDMATWVEKNIVGKDGHPVKRDNAMVYIYNAEQKIAAGSYPPKVKEKKEKVIEAKTEKVVAAAKAQEPEGKIKDAKEKNLATMKKVKEKLAKSDHVAEPVVAAPIETEKVEEPSELVTEGAEVAALLGSTQAEEASTDSTHGA